MNLRRWLRREPQPHSVRIGDGDTATTVRVVRESRTCWADVESAILAQPQRVVHCLDKAGATLRSIELASDEPDEASAPGRTAPVEVLSSADARDIRLAQLFIEAGDRGAARAVEGLSQAVNALINVVQVCVDQVGAMREEVEASREAAAAAISASQGGDAGKMGQLLQLVAAGQQAAAAAATKKDPPGAKGGE